MQRRKFVAAAALAASAAQAADGPVRATPLKAGYWGAQFYDEKERAELLDVLEAKSPFRWYGPQPPTKVLQFEKEFAARMASRYALGVTSGTAALHHRADVHSRFAAPAQGGGRADWGEPPGDGAAMAGHLR